MQVTVKTVQDVNLGDHEFPELPQVEDTVTVATGDRAGEPLLVIRRVLHGSSQRDAPIRPIIIVASGRVLR